MVPIKFLEPSFNSLKGKISTRYTRSKCFIFDLKEGPPYGGPTGYRVLMSVLVSAFYCVHLQSIIYQKILRKLVLTKICRIPPYFFQVLGWVEILNVCQGQFPSFSYKKWTLVLLYVCTQYMVNGEGFFRMLYKARFEKY